MVRCDECHIVFSSKRTLYQHIRQKHNDEPTLHLQNLICGHCDPSVSSSSNLLRHIRIFHNLTGNFKYLSYSLVFGCEDLLETHEKHIHLQASRSALFQRPVSDHNLEASCVQTSVNDNFKAFRAKFGPENAEPFQFLTPNEQSIISFVNEKLPAYESERVGITIHVKLCKPLEDHFVTISFHSSMARLAHQLDADEYTNMIDSLRSQLNI